jgi:hypothetical protein
MPDAAIAAMSPEQAQTRLDELKANPDWGKLVMSNHPAALSEFHELTEQITGVKAPPAPSLALSPQERLDKMMADPGFVKAFQAGEVAAKQAFDAATAAVADGQSLGEQLNDNARALGMEFTVGPSAVTNRTMDEAVAGWRDLGLSDGMIYELMEGRQIDTGKPWPSETVAKVRALRTQKMNDPEWVGRLQKGGWLEKRELTLMSGILMHYT